MVYLVGSYILYFTINELRGGKYMMECSVPDYEKIIRERFIDDFLKKMLILSADYKWSKDLTECEVVLKLKKLDP